MKLRIIGDVHGKIDQYLKIASEAEYSIQLGDMGFDYSKIENSGLSAYKHNFFAGNHDNYDTINDCRHSVGDYGRIVYPSSGSGILDTEVFFIRGADSIDKQYRRLGIDWWDNEELSYQECLDCIEAYTKYKPDIVLSHDCPQFIAEKTWKIYEKSKTRQLLEILYHIHQPKQWYFGHHHKALDYITNTTKFVCLPELSYIDIEV